MQLFKESDNSNFKKTKTKESYTNSTFPKLDAGLTLL